MAIHDESTVVGMATRISQQRFAQILRDFPSPAAAEAEAVSGAAGPCSDPVRAERCGGCMSDAKPLKGADHDRCASGFR
jgi:hypothetical protein